VVAEAVAIEGNLLLGTALLQDYLLQVEVSEGGEVAIEPL
jgi:hypothetical protein